MNKEDFYFDLPLELIAQYPLAQRTDSRLLTYNRQEKAYGHRHFNELAELLEPGDLLVMNNSKVIPARFYGTKESGGRVEFLLERIYDSHSFLAHIKASKPPRPGMVIYLDKQWQITIIEKRDDVYHCSVEGDVELLLQDIGHIPLPPYLNREAEALDSERYQTVYAKHNGSVAAPTAGLHFDEKCLAQLQAKGINIAYTTLHVGAGTFRPVRSTRLAEHKMHREHCTVSEDVCELVNQTKASRKRVIAVGTTAMRSLETAASDGHLKPYTNDTEIFIYPGYTFKVCDGLLTNFHLPESTLIMLVSAFIGHSEAMSLYCEAIAHKYRFFSYGDASLLL